MNKFDTKISTSLKLSTHTARMCSESNHIFLINNPFKHYNERFFGRAPPQNEVAISNLVADFLSKKKN